MKRFPFLGPDLLDPFVIRALLENLDADSPDEMARLHRFLLGLEVFHFENPPEFQPDDTMINRGNKDYWNYHTTVRMMEPKTLLPFYTSLVDARLAASFTSFNPSPEAVLKIARKPALDYILEYGARFGTVLVYNLHDDDSRAIFPKMAVQPLRLLEERRLEAEGILCAPPPPAPTEIRPDNVEIPKPDPALANPARCSALLAMTRGFVAGNDAYLLHKRTISKHYGGKALPIWRWGRSLSDPLPNVFAFKAAWRKARALARAEEAPAEPAPQEQAAPESASPEAAPQEPAAPESASPEASLQEPAAPEPAAPETTAMKPADKESASPETAAQKPAAPESTAPASTEIMPAAQESAPPETAAQQPAPSEPAPDGPAPSEPADPKEAAKPEGADKLKSFKDNLMGAMNRLTAAKAPPPPPDPAASPAGGAEAEAKAAGPAADEPRQIRTAQAAPSVPGPPPGGDLPEFDALVSPYTRRILGLDRPKPAFGYLRDHATELDREILDQFYDFIFDPKFRSDSTDPHLGRWSLKSAINDLGWIISRNDPDFDYDEDEDEDYDDYDGDEGDEDDDEGEDDEEDEGEDDDEGEDEDDEDEDEDDDTFDEEYDDDQDSHSDYEFNAWNEQDLEYRYDGSEDSELNDDPYFKDASTDFLQYLFVYTPAIRKLKKLFASDECTRRQVLYLRFSIFKLEYKIMALQDAFDMRLEELEDLQTKTRNLAAYKKKMDAAYSSLSDQHRIGETRAEELRRKNKELEEAKAELTATANKLKSENLRYSAELDVAKKEIEARSLNPHQLLEANDRLNEEIGVKDAEIEEKALQILELQLKLEGVTETLSQTEKLRQEDQRNLSQLRADLDSAGEWLYPDTLEEVVEAGQRYYGSKLIFHERLHKSISEFEASEMALKARVVPEAVRMVKALAEVLHPMKFERDELSQDAFLSMTGIPMTMTERRATKRERALTDQRTCFYNGRKITFFPHLKSSIMGTEFRLYFQFLDDERKIIVCHLGGHLPTAGTRLM